MIQKTHLYILIGLIICGAFLLGPAELSAKSQEEQERKFQERIEIMKRDPKDLYFAKTETPLAEQEIIAQDLLKKLQDLSKTEGFDSPDYDKILEYAREILLKAPDTEVVQMAHWNIFTLFLMQEYHKEAGKALESYLYKYPDDEFQVFQAYDNLSIFAMDEEDWGRALYYADKILENDPERYPLILTKARALIGLGEKARGKALLERIIKEAEGTIQYNLAMMELDELNAAKESNEPPIDPEEEAKGGGREDARKQDLPPVDSVQDPLLVEKYRKTMDGLRSVTYSIQVYQMDEMKLPEQLADLAPAFSKEEQLMDAWGKPFHYKIDTRNNTFWLASGGSDGQFQGFDQKGTFVELDGEDIISYDTDFVFQPDFR
ncbi:MAG: tetratricopeptide repeat protein [Anaerolineales bacterium]|nr:tetratricopeptide repeat protein [Anaerolineales bacterium]